MSHRSWNRLRPFLSPQIARPRRGHLAFLGPLAGTIADFIAGSIAGSIAGLSAGSIADHIAERSLFFALTASSELGNCSIT